MTLKEAIDIGRAVGCVTIEDVDNLIFHLYNSFELFTEEELESYIQDYDIWEELYYQEFPKLNFYEVKI